jgi:acetylornithine deacetylase/succinyl-diaminopimelate desuccinylase-like protein
MESKVEKIRGFVEEEFDNNVLPSLMDFVRIPNLSRDYDPEWNTNGQLEKAAQHLLQWVEAQDIKGLKAEIIQLENLSPFLFIEIEGSDSKTNERKVLMYGHLDKQPHFCGWNEGTGPVSPVVIEEKLYGRGCSDDGYALYAAILSIKCL